MGDGFCNSLVFLVSFLVAGRRGLRNGRAEALGLGPALGRAFGLGLFLGSVLLLFTLLTLLTVLVEFAVTA